MMNIYLFILNIHNSNTPPFYTLKITFCFLPFVAKFVNEIKHYSFASYLKKYKLRECYLLYRFILDC